MKFRNGFVSNSSSSSFVLLTTKKAHEQILAQLSEEERASLADMFNESQCLGQTVFETSSWNGQDYSCWEDMKDGVYDAWNKYCDIANKLDKTEVYTFEQEW